MKARVLCMFLTILMLLTFASCAPATLTQDYADYIPSEAERLVIYTSLDEAVYEPLVREFEAAYGIWVQVTSDASSLLFEQLEGSDTECDLLLGAFEPEILSHNELFTPYDKSGELFTAISRLPVVLVYNPKLVRTNPPTGFTSLLDSEWRGRIAFADPAATGSAYIGLLAVYETLSDTYEGALLHDLKANLGGTLMADTADVLAQVANGNCCIGVCMEDEALRIMEKGYDIAMLYPREGIVAVCDTAAIVKDCPHEANAQLFIDFLLLDSTQEFLFESCKRLSVLSKLSPSEEEILQFGTPCEVELSAEIFENIITSWEE